MHLVSKPPPNCPRTSSADCHVSWAACLGYTSWSNSDLVSLNEKGLPCHSHNQIILYCQMALEQKASHSPFIDLPLELQYEIISHLPTEFPGKYTLRRTCRYFYNLIAQPTHPELLIIERQPFCKLRNLLACKLCLRLRQRSKFGDVMLHQYPGWGKTCPEDRFCVDCGVKKVGHWPPRYTKGSILKVMGTTHVVCLKCGNVGICASTCKPTVKGHCIRCFDFSNVSSSFFESCCWYICLLPLAFAWINHPRHVYPLARMPSKHPT